MSTTTATPTLADALTFITNSATSADLDTILRAFRARDRALKTLTAAAVHVGMDVKLSGLSPKYLNGLTGQVVAISGARGTVRLDEQSTRLLGVSSSRYYTLVGKQSHDLTGIPLACLTAR